MGEREDLGDWVGPLIRVDSIGSGTNFWDKGIELHLGHVIL